MVPYKYGYSASHLNHKRYIRRFPMGYVINKNNINYTETLGTHRYEGHTINGKLDGEIYRYDMDMYHPNTLTSVLEYQDGK